MPEFINELDELSCSYHDDNYKINYALHNRELNGVGIDFGIENFSDRILEKFRKGFNSELIENVLVFLNNYSFDIGLYMITFCPWISINEILYNIKKYYELYMCQGYMSINTFLNLFKPLVLYSGCDLYDDLHESELYVAPRKFRFEDRKTALFYLIYQNEIVKWENSTNENVFELYQYCVKAIQFCIDLNTSEITILDNVICGDDNRKIYYWLVDHNLYFPHD